MRWILVGAATLALSGRAVGSWAARAVGSQPQLHQPTPTTSDQETADNHGVPPAPFPTRGPDLAEMDMDLRRRQIFIGTDTCGFISGIFKQSYVCNLSTRSCTTVGDFIACCPTSSVCHDFPTTCIPSPAISCANTDLQTACCSNSASPACYTALLSGASGFATGYACYPFSTEVTMLSLPTDVNVSPSHTSASTTSTSASSSNTGSTSTSASSSSTGSTSSSSSASASQSTTSSPAPSSGSSTPVGAIVGGVVGGLAIIGAVIIAAIFILKHKRKTTGDAAAAPVQPVNPNLPPDQQTYTASPSSGYTAMYPQQGQYQPQMSQQGGHLYPQQMQPTEYSPSAASPQGSQYTHPAQYTQVPQYAHPTAGTIYKPYGVDDPQHQPPTQAYELDPNQQHPHELQ